MENHCRIMAERFSGNQLYNTMVRQWWWEEMYKDVDTFCKSCPQCAIVTEGIKEVSQVRVQCAITVNHEHCVHT